MSRELPAIVKTAMRILVALEEATGRFPRRHKYGLGAKLRDEAMEVARRCQVAWRDRAHQLERAMELSESIDDLKLRLQLAGEVQAFRSSGEFESIARLVNGLGMQCGGWLKRLQSKGRNVSGNPPPQSALILSTQAASTAGAQA